MARARLTKATAPGSYAADGVVLPATAADVGLKNDFISTGNELVIAFNTNAGATPRAVTITSVVNAKNRTGHITSDSIAAGAFHVYGPFKKNGWAQPDGVIHLEADNAEVKFLVVQLP